MQKAYDFDFVNDTQKVFRKLLLALSNPGKQYSISEEMKGFSDKWAALLAVGCTMQDNETTFYVEKTPEFQQKLRELTLAKFEEVEKAQYIYLTSPVNYVNWENLLRSIKKGSLKDPQESATILVECETLEGNQEITLEGPGIDGELKIKGTEYMKTLMTIKQNQKMEYPCGIDIFLITHQGKIMGLPRLCRIKQER